jgi:hypothetical protein
VLSEQIAKCSYAEDIICTDIDHCAIDQLFLRCLGRFGTRLKSAVFRFQELGIQLRRNIASSEVQERLCFDTRGDTSIIIDLRVLF